MATTRIIPLHAGKGRTVGKAISDIIDYVKNPEKTDHGRLITSYQCDSRVADAQFLLDKQTYAARTGRVRGADNVIAYHLRQSFVPGEITPEEANRLGVELARRFTKGKHAFIVCTHIDKAHVHNHIIWNSTTLECDRKFRNFWGSTRAVHRLSDTICIENGYSIVEAPKRRGQSYNKWLGDAAKPSHKEQLRQAIDRALAQKPASLEELLRLLEQDGFTVHRRGKNISIGAEGWGNNVRFDRLGDGYTLDDLLAVLSGQKEHTPRKQAVPQAAPPKVNLLVDIQAKLQAGKGAGYARWAKVFNLKQMAQTLNYLSEHGLLDYADLETKTAEATARYNALSDQIKAAEKRMAEIAVLRTHIVNYAKTRETYVAYRKAGYSKKFRQEHEEEILLHQAAKEAFNELNVKKLPTIKELQTEYAQLLAEKTGVPAYSTKEARGKLPSKAEIFYMGWLLAGTVRGIQSAMDRYTIRGAAIVGISPQGNGDLWTEARINGGYSDSGGRLFYLQGGYAPEKLGFFHRLMMKPMARSVIRQVEGKGDAATAQEREMAEVFRRGGDFVREEALEEIVQWFREGDHTGEVKTVPRVEI